LERGERSAGERGSAGRRGGGGGGGESGLGVCVGGAFAPAVI
jgi:hypothetical protein